ncbi:TRAF3-interacting protein 1-like isoform X2 [Dunckerocampus dactyliophorus]|uniref:TRAF3-interacting protein 1-like isoform X2 n=1 Tax=Dunckerocampus dactyliophorus TaxID=161453 RepID=UPI002406E9F3|nr:TRAF3-interacting protein 1-like isoform X2 [Dunckerocampus dactyliophorus]
MSLRRPMSCFKLLPSAVSARFVQMSSRDAVKRVLAGERLDMIAKDITFKENLERCELHLEREEKKKIEQSECKEEKDPEQHREQERQRREGDRDHRHDREHSGKNHRREQDQPKNCDQDKACDRQGDTEKDNGQGKARGREKEQAKDQERENIKAKDNEKEKVPNTASERSKCSSSQPTCPSSLSQSSSANDQSKKHTLGDAAQKPLSKEGGDTVASSFSSEMASSDKQTARPSSARPAPPRVKTQESFTDGVPSERLSSAKSSVIIDGKKLSDDDDNEDEQFLVAEAAPEPADAPERPFESAHDLNVEEKHGGLVKKILETKKDYELSSIKSKEKMVSEEAWKKEQDLVMREIERLRASIQSVCQSALPLGKLMDYVQEDIDAMQAELQSWRKENKEHAQALLQEQRATDQAVEPLKTELGELDQMIKDYQDKICTMRCNILMNEEKIQKKLAAIISSKT